MPLIFCKDCAHYYNRFAARENMGYPPEHHCRLTETQHFVDAISESDVVVELNPNYQNCRNDCKLFTLRPFKLPKLSWWQRLFGRAR